MLLVEMQEGVDKNAGRDRQRLLPSAQLGLTLGLGFVVVDREPLHIAWIVGAAAFERDYMVDLVSGAWQHGLTRGRAGVRVGELITRHGTAVHAGVCWRNK